MTNASLLPWLVADIGGTNARFGLVRETGGDVGEVRSFRCADFASPEAAALAYLQQLAAPGLDRVRPARVALALATAIDGDSVQMTNSAWRVSRAAVAQALGAAEVVLLNDFEALALALPRLANADAVGAVQWIGPARPDRRHTMAVVGPGTGLGVAACVPAASRGAGLIAPQDEGSAGFIAPHDQGSAGCIALPGEGGHATLAPADDFESELLGVLRAELGHVSAEHVLSGIGLPHLHRAVCRVQGLPVESLGAAAISQRALVQHDAACIATLDTFCAMLGGFAGNAALTLGARGGVFLAGGIAQKLGPTLAASRFRARFEAKGRFAVYLSRIATGLIVAPHAALDGAAQSLR